MLFSRPEESSTNPWLAIQRAEPMKGWVMADLVATDRDSWLREACRLQSLSRWPEALACYEEAVRISPRDLQTLVPLGFALIQLKDWGRAAETYERIVALLPKDHR